ncbi:PaaI family thioesterase [Azospirillum doebereinerae]|uniref:PaaI family thioesterase n=1 Tax=Azospirillum doebereinerae TaxID=92933 RepID=A0A3S0XQ28_9PROT|nr:PaaI family thioesterase [Azospirillum doebereinerae]MCG5238593.1 PaaI family thioesterase [Azospirillum doebereinerae]RUQ74660.1 PaaI family thioesterase [Azospirillum doebereinerae]
MTDLLDGEAPSGYQELLGYRLSRWEEGLAEMELPLTAAHLNRAGVVHGGVLMSLLDTVSGFSVTFCPVEGRLRRAMTLSLSTSFLGQARDGTLVATGRLRGGGRKIVGAAAEIRHRETGALLATSEGMFKYRPGSENREGIER